MRTTAGGLALHRRLEARARTARRTHQDGKTASPHQSLPGQAALFTLNRSWDRLDETKLPPLTPESQALLGGFAHHITDRGWSRDAHSSAHRTLHVIVAYLGAQVPIPEADVRAVAHLRRASAARIINYLRTAGMLIPDPRPDWYLTRARHLAQVLPEGFSAPALTWIEVLLGHGARPGRRRASSTIYHYLCNVKPVLDRWARQGIDDLRSITPTHIDEAVKPVQGEAAHSRATALRSLFRALKRERLIFRNPATALSVSIPIALPLPVPTDRLRTALATLTTTRARLCFALAAVHALSVADQRGILLEDLNRTTGRLTVRRPGRADHIVFLDELTSTLATAYLAERHRLWPATANPHLLVTGRTSADDTHPPVSTEAVVKPIRAIKLTVGALRADRILNEAQHKADPVHLMRQFGISACTAVRYLHTAYPAGPPVPVPAGLGPGP
ncbi:hypothetical protein [Streptomyces sp. NPDC048269]|uniref:hypothetical protein n=1 Tax=Streptomyces sp. NPDC048269 TaxID=3155753 RepID=UPI0034351131